MFSKNKRIDWLATNPKTLRAERVIKVMRETKTGDKTGKKENPKCTLPVDNSVVTSTFWSRKVS